jgi:hypothetical protein
VDSTRREFNARMLGSLMTFGPGDLSTISDHKDNTP